MKISDFKIPFSWNERRSALLERCLYIPSCYNRHAEWKVFPWSDIFGNTQLVCIEYCSGNGQWIAEKAKQRPEVNWVAVEKSFDRARKIWARSFRENLANLFVVLGEALVFSRYYAPKASISEIFVNFPDPWPKNRHAKHRLIRVEFLEELAHVGKEGAKAMFVTDDTTYAIQMTKELSRCPSWHPLLASPHFTNEWPEYGASFFNDLWRSQGRTIHYLPYELAR